MKYAYATINSIVVNGNAAALPHCVNATSHNAAADKRSIRLQLFSQPLAHGGGADFQAVDHAEMVGPRHGAQFHRVAQCCGCGVVAGRLAGKLGALGTAPGDPGGCGAGAP